MYLCSTLRLAWGGKFCCCQILIDDLQLCLANRNTFFLFAMIEVQHQKQTKVEMILKSSCSWCSPWCFQRDWNMCSTGAAVQMAPLFFLWLLGFRSCRFSHSLTSWNLGREWVARRQSMGAFFLAISLFHSYGITAFCCTGVLFFASCCVLLLPGRSMIFAVSAPWSITLSDMSFISPDCEFWPQNSAQVNTSKYLFTRLKVMRSLGWCFWFPCFILL